jgi:hypothetical protein
MRPAEPTNRSLGAARVNASRPGASPAGCFYRFTELLADPVSGASLAVCRIAVGLVTVLEVFSLCHPSQIVAGKIPAQIYFVGPEVHFNFPYYGFEWLPLLPAPWFYGLLALTRRLFPRMRRRRTE